MVTTVGDAGSVTLALQAAPGYQRLQTLAAGEQCTLGLLWYHPSPRLEVQFVEVNRSAPSTFKYVAMKDEASIGLLSLFTVVFIM